MKSKILIGSALIAASQLSFAGSVNTSCMAGAFTVELGVYEGEACSVSQTVMINGNAQTEMLTISSDTANVFELAEGDSLTATIQMSCTSPYGDSKTSGSAATANGCHGLLNSTEFEIPEAPEHEFPEAPEHEFPEVPEHEFPEEPKFEIPEMPEFEIPEMPEFEIPEEPEFEIPEAPEFEIPETPEFEIPETPEFEIPEAPEFEIPEEYKF